MRSSAIALDSQSYFVRLTVWIEQTVVCNSLGQHEYYLFTVCF